MKRELQQCDISVLEGLLSGKTVSKHARRISTNPLVEEGLVTVFGWFFEISKLGLI